VNGNAGFMQAIDSEILRLKSTSDVPQAADCGALRAYRQRKPNRKSAWHDHGDLRLSRAFNLALHRFEVPLDAVHANSKRVNQVEVLTVLRQHRRKHAVDNVSIVR
jgi:hypothetical protein